MPNWIYNWHIDSLEWWQAHPAIWWWAVAAGIAIVIWSRVRTT